MRLVRTEQYLAAEHFGVLPLCFYSRAFSAACAHFDIEYDLAVRCMISESAAYDNQISAIKRRHRREKDLKTSDEYLSGMERGGSSFFSPQKQKPEIRYAF
jgi:hypothetical protein